jgi:hypothetical protein
MGKMIKMQEKEEMLWEEGKMFRNNCNKKPIPLHYSITK